MRKDYALVLMATLLMGQMALAPTICKAQTKPYVSDVWVADQGDGTFKNPVLYADYSDPDVRGLLSHGIEF